MFGDTPYVVRGGQTDPKKIFYSKPELAFTKTIQIPGGYGVLPMGQFMGKITESTGRLGQYVPYAPESPDAPTWIGAEPTLLPALAYLTTDGAANTNVWVSKEDSYKFAVGDHLAVNDVNSDSPTDLGAISSIDRTTYSTLAQIVVANQVTTAYTVAQGAAVYIQTAESTPFTAAAGVLFAAVDTGKGENAKGANGVMILKNALLYKNALQVYHADILSDITGSADQGNLFSM